MTRIELLRVPVVVVAVVGFALAARPAGAETKQARGNVAAVSDSSLTVRAGDRTLTFTVNADTLVEAPGAGRQSRTSREAGGHGVKLTQFVKAGKPVLVTYRETNGGNQAVRVRPIASPGSSDAAKSDPARIASGEVKSITADHLIVSRRGQDLTFAVNASTTVSAPGAGRAAKAAGGRLAITDLVGHGDTVSVTYRDNGSTLNASQVRITVKAR